MAKETLSDDPPASFVLRKDDPAEVRRAKHAAHTEFDRIWRGYVAQFRWSKAKARTRAYKKLARALDLPKESCHIAQFDTAKCTHVIEACRLGLVEMQYRR